MDNGIFLSDVSKRDKPWDTHRAQAERVQFLYEHTKFSRYSERISKCSGWLGFKWVLKDSTGELGLHLEQAEFCRVRFCTVCQWRRSQMWLARFYNAVPKVLETYPKHRFVFLTLTVKNCPVDELRLTIGEMNHAWYKLTKRKAFPALGWLKSVEVTRNQVSGSPWFGTAHPHFHVLLMVPESYFSGANYMSKAKWAALWQDCLKADYLPVVDVRSVKPKAGQDHAQALRKALLETLKYSVKPGDLMGSSDSKSVQLDKDWLVELTDQMLNSRAVSVGGILRQFIDESEPEDFIHGEGDVSTESGSQVDITFGWREEVKRYKSIKS